LACIATKMRQTDEGLMWAERRMDLASHVSPPMKHGIQSTCCIIVGSCCIAFYSIWLNFRVLKILLVASRILFGGVPDFKSE
jgi:hypothetical protein